MDGSIPTTEAFTHELGPQADEVSKKLRGGVWERSDLARGTYGVVLGLGRWLSTHGVTPNSLTYAALSFALASGVAAAMGHYLVAALCLLVSVVNPIGSRVITSRTKLSYVRSIVSAAV